MLEARSNKHGITVNRARRIIVLCLVVVLNTSADMIVDLGSARDFMFLDISRNPATDALISKGMFNGDIGWSGGSGTQLMLKQSTVGGDLYHAADSSLSIRRGAELTGTEYAAADMAGFIADVEAAVANFATLTQDIDLGAVRQTGSLTINRTDAYTVVDMSEFRLSSGTLTLNGEAGDIFYIRVRDVFELINVDVVVNGTDASRVFFIYDGTDDVEFKRGDFLGNIVAPNAAVLMSSLNQFDGSVISGNGFDVSGSSKTGVYEHVVAIPEATVLGLVTVVGGAALFIHRFFRCRKVGSGT